MKSTGLGRGLSALIEASEETKAPIAKQQNKISEKKDKSNLEIEESKDKKSSPTVEYKYIDTRKIEPNPFQPRKEFDETAIEELAQAITKSGFITPILVCKKKDSEGFVLVAGERRLRACKLLGLAEIPAIIKNLSDAQMMQIAIIENVQRKNLNPIEEAKAFHNMQEKLKMTVEEVATSIGLPLYYVSFKLKLTRLPEIVQRYVADGELSEGAAVALLKLDSEDGIIAAAKIAVRQNMSKASVEKLVEKILLSKGLEPKDPIYHFRNKYRYYLDAFKDNLGWNMKLRGGVNGKGKIEIEFADEMDLKEIYKQLEKILK